MRLLLFVFILCSVTLRGQTDLLARNYFDQGEFEKAKTLYSKLLRQEPNRLEYLLALVETHQQLEEFEAAELLLVKRLAGRGVIPQLYVDLGHNYALQQQDSLAEESYRQAIAYVEERPGSAYSIGKTFQEYSLLDKAAQVFERAMELDPERNFKPQLARIYGEQGKLDLMFDTYLDLMQTNPAYRAVAQRNFSMYVNEDPGNEANVLLRRALLKRIQNAPSSMYNQLLSWLFIQQADYDKAFVQEKAIYRRSEGDLEGIIDLVFITLSAEAWEEAEEIVSFLIEEAPSLEVRLEGEKYRMQIKVKRAQPSEYGGIDQEFEQLLNEYGRAGSTFGIQLEQARFLAYQYDQPQRSIDLLKSLLEEKLSEYQQGQARMLMADVLVAEERFNEALINYSRIQRSGGNSIQSQEAAFKVARTSYFKGDFQWAQVQLDVLKQSASQLIANDAMQLSLMIKDNSLEDSTQVALKNYAISDLKKLQGNYDEAILTLRQILLDHKGTSIEDEALLSLGECYELVGQYERAVETYQKLIEFHGDDILADDAHYRLGLLYEEKLAQPDLAKGHYETILFEHSDSIFFVDARKRYRNLRGDSIN